MASNGLQLFELLETVAGALSGLESMTGVTVLEENRKEVEQEIKAALGKLGLLVMVGGVEATNRAPNASKPVWSPIEFAVVVSESPLLNRSQGGSSAQEVADLAAEALQLQVTDWGTIVVQSIRPVFDKKLNIYEVECRIG